MSQRLISATVLIAAAMLIVIAAFSVRGPETDVGNGESLESSISAGEMRAQSPSVGAMDIESTQKEDPGYYLIDYMGRIAVIKSGEETPDIIFDVYTKTLPSTDRESLTKGIYVEDIESLEKIIEDYIS